MCFTSLDISSLLTDIGLPPMKFFAARPLYTSSSICRHHIEARTVQLKCVRRYSPHMQSCSRPHQRNIINMDQCKDLKPPDQQSTKTASAQAGTGRTNYGHSALCTGMRCPMVATAFPSQAKHANTVSLDSRCMLKQLFVCGYWPRTAFRVEGHQDMDTHRPLDSLQIPVRTCAAGQQSFGLCSISDAIRAKYRPK